MNPSQLWQKTKNPFTAIIFGASAFLYPILGAMILRLKDVYQGHNITGPWHEGYGACGANLANLFWPCDAPVTANAGVQLMIFGAVVGLTIWLYRNQKVTLKSFVLVPVIPLLALALANLAVPDMTFGWHVTDEFQALAVAISMTFVALSLIISRSEQQKQARLTAAPAS